MSTQKITPTYAIPDALASDIAKLHENVAKYKQQEISNAEFKAFRVPMGLYEQRKDEVYMSRVRATGGLIRPQQLSELIDIAVRHGSNLLHVTTRAEVQILNLNVDELEPIQRELRDIHLSTKGGGGNTVRNILVGQFAGIGQNEAFDPTPYAVALTSIMVAEPDTYLLPRKLKIAFEPDPAFTNFAAINDIGFVAKVRDGQRGFEVYVGGGAGGRPTTGWKLSDFWPADDIYAVVKGVKRFFFDRGNRKNKNVARLRYVFYKNGIDFTLNEIRQYIAEAQKLGIQLEPAFLGESRPHVEYKGQSIAPAEADDFLLWRSRYVSKQRQEGYFTVLFPIILGNIELEPERVANLKKVLAFVGQFGEDTLRFTTTQSLRFRNIPETALPELWHLLRWFADETSVPLVVSNLQSCTGADTCRLGLVFSKGVSKAIRRELLRSHLDLDLLSNVNIHVTGCPNSCGQQLWADLGFAGYVLRKDGRPLPGYKVYAAAQLAGDFHLAEAIGTIPARDVPRFVVRLLEAYLPSAKKQTFNEYLHAGGLAVAKALLDDYQDVPSFADDKNYYFDWDAEQLFSVTAEGKPECAAGVFDRINIDYETVTKSREALLQETDRARRAELLQTLVLASARMLLITLGHDAQKPDEVFPLFKENFIGGGYVDKRFATIIDLAAADPKADLSAHETHVLDLAQAIVDLYNSLDDTMQLKAPQVKSDDTTAAPANAAFASTAKPDVVKDFRGVACPMNFVKTKIALSPLASGSVLEIWLDDGQPIQNVPGSVKLEGHTILEQQQTPDGYWRVVIRKK